MPWGDNRPREEEPLWCLVDDGCESTCVTLMAETKIAREQRHEGTLKPDGKTTLRELDDEINHFINSIRMAGGQNHLNQLVAAISSEAAQLEASKFRERQSNSSIS